MTSCGQPSLDRPLGRSKDGHLQGIEWLGHGGTQDTLSKIDPIFDRFFVPVDRRVASDVCVTWIPCEPVMICVIK
jgi:hypothetical protein